MAYELKDYREVAERVGIWYDRFPEGRIVPEVLEWERDRVMVRASVFRTSDPSEPPAGVGHSFLAIPGKTPYTKDSELENAETSAVGRALVMAGIPAKQVASEHEIKSKSGPVEPAGHRGTASDGMAGTDTALAEGEGVSAEGAGGPSGPPAPDPRALSSQIRTLVRLAEELRWSDDDIDNALHEAFPDVEKLKDLSQSQARELIPTWESASRAIRFSPEQESIVRTLAALSDAKHLAEQLFGRKVPNLHTLTVAEGEQLIAKLREIRVVS